MNTSLLIGMGIGLVVLLLLSALFSFSEMALASVNKIKLQTETKATGVRAKRAKRALKFVNTYNETVTSIVIMNNIVNILNTTLATLFFGGIFGVGSAMGPIVSFIVMTLLTIVIGEVTPKMMAKKHNLNGVIWLSMILQITVWSFYPITWLINKFIDNSEEVMLETDEDIKAALKETASAGHIETEERDLLVNALELDNTNLSKIMIPYEKIEYLKNNANRKVIQNAIIETGFTRYPVLNSNDEVVGVYNSKFFINDMLEEKTFKLDRSLYETSFFIKTDKLDDVLSELRKNRQHMGIVVSKINSKKMIGVITIEDIVEEIVGELYDESDREQNGILDVDNKHFAIHSSAKAIDVLREVYHKNKDSKIKSPLMSFSKWLMIKFDVKKLEEGQHYAYKNSIIWVRKDKKTSRKNLSFDIDIVE